MSNCGKLHNSDRNPSIDRLSLPSSLTNSSNEMPCEEKSHVISVYPLSWKLQLCIIASTSLCTTLDGYLLIFLAFNSHVYKSEWKWSDSHISNLTIIYHIISATGGMCSIFTSNRSNKIGLSYASIICLLGFLVSIPLISIQHHLYYYLAFCIICFANGHMSNICSNLIIQKLCYTKRAFMYFLSYSFNLFGQLLFSCIMYSLMGFITWGNTILTIIPLYILIMLQILLCTITLRHMRSRRRLKQEKMEMMNKARKKSLLWNEEVEGREINLNKNINEIKESIEKTFHHDLRKLILAPVKYMFTNKMKNHTLNMAFMNLSIGIQFFSMINVFPHLGGKDFFSSMTSVNQNILIYKSTHTLCLVITSFLFLLPFTRRKLMLVSLFIVNMALNFIIIFDITDILKSPFTRTNNTFLFHVFRNLWVVNFFIINLYCAEAVRKDMRNLTTSLMFFIFKISCVVEMGVLDSIISIHAVLPVLFNILVLLGQIILVCRLKIETHFQTREEIEKQLANLYNG